MRKLVAGFAISADGYIEDVNGKYDWILIDKEIDFAKEMQRYDTYFFGRVSYENALSMGTAAFGNDKCYVFSKTLEKVEAPYQLIKENVSSFIKDLKQQQGKDIALFGGAVLLTSLIEIGVVDEISLSIIPVLLGAGKPFVGMLKNKITLNLKESKTYANCTVRLTYSLD